MTDEDDYEDDDDDGDPDGPETGGYTFWHGINGTLEVTFPKDCSVELSGSSYHGWGLVVKRLTKRQQAALKAKRKKR